MARKQPDADFAEGLTARQRDILAVIRSAVEERGYPPSVREIGEAVGLTSPSSVAHQLGVLEKKGLLRRDANRPRALVVADETSSIVDAGADITGIGDATPAAAYVPVLGRIAAPGGDIDLDVEAAVPGRLLDRRRPAAAATAAARGAAPRRRVWPCTHTHTHVGGMRSCRACGTRTVRGARPTPWHVRSMAAVSAAAMVLTACNSAATDTAPTETATESASAAA